jgi:hypothetical protein
LSRLKLRPNYVLAFAVRGKRKVGRFFSPTKGSYADYHETLRLLIGEMGEGCKIQKDGVAAGSVALVNDVYELDDLPGYVWEEYRRLLPKDSVEAIEKEAEETGGFVTANVTHEDSIFAVVED